METLVESGFFSAVLDMTTTEWADEVCGGVLSAGSEAWSGRQSGDTTGRYSGLHRHV